MRLFNAQIALTCAAVALASCARDSGVSRDGQADGTQYVTQEGGVPPQGVPVEVDVMSFSPEERTPTDADVGRLNVPPNFRVNVFARDVGHARMLAAARDGTVYVTTPRQGRVLALRDLNTDGRADELMVVAEGLEGVHGITLHDNMIYLAAPTKVWSAPRMQDGTLGELRLIIDDLPDGGQHPNRTLAVGPGNKLYISVGSTCNACPETNEEHATILRSELDGSSREIFATGLRNTIGYGWHPQTGEMWGMDHGSDERGNDIPPEELNRLEEGNNYGWPYAYGKQRIDPIITPPPGQTKEQFAQASTPSVLEYQAHSAPIGMIFYQGTQFPQRYRNGAFVAMRGSWNRYPAVGYKIVFIDFEGGEPVGFEDFVSGFLVNDGREHLGRLAGVATAADGSLLFTDDHNGVIYRVSYLADQQRPVTTPANEGLTR